MSNEKAADRGQAGRDNARSRGGNANGPGGVKEDSGEKEVQEKVDEANEKGFYGTTPPGPPDEAYALPSGPDAPTVLDERAAAQDQ